MFKVIKYGFFGLLGLSIYFTFFYGSLETVETVTQPAVKIEKSVVKEYELTYKDDPKYFYCYDKRKI